MNLLTIIGGVSIFVMGQIILRFIIEPILDFKRLIGEITYSLIFYANIYMNPSPPYTDLSEDNEIRNDTQKIFRELASQLCQKAGVIPWFKIWEISKILPKQQGVTEATEELIRLSNSIHRVDVNFNRAIREKIQRLLNIKIVKNNNRN